MMQQTVLINTESTSGGTRGAIYQELVPFSLTYAQMGDSLIKGEELLRDQLLETKFFVPVASHALIPRPRLTALLDTCPRRPLTLVSAPAGFGKTTLLSEWVQALSPESIQVAWVSLDEEDNDLVRFWRYMLTALDRLQPGVCTDLVTRLRTQSSPPLPCLLTKLINRLVQSPKQMLLVLDDYQMITDPAVHTSFTSLVEHLPAQLRVVLSTRVDPPFPLSRLRARSQLLEVRTEQLSCSDTEVADFLHEIVGVELFDDEVQQIATRTGGWLAGLQLLDLSLQRREDSFSGQDEVISSHHHIVDYLTEEVLRQQPPAIQHFLLHTSILERLTAPLCDAVLEQSGSQQVLEELKRANLFLISLDSQRRWYRYHPLFAEALRFWLERVDPEVCEVLHLRASAWYAEHGHSEEAIEHAIRAHAWQQAADFIEAEMWTSNERRWEPAILRHWLEQLPPEVVYARPRLCFAYASALLPVASATTVDAWLKAAEAGLATSSGLLSDMQMANEASVQDDRKDLLYEIAAFRALHTCSYNDGQDAQVVQGFFHKDDQVSPAGSEPAQAVQVEVLRTQAKPVAPRAEARTEEGGGKLTPLQRPYRPYERPAPQRAPQQDLPDPLSARELEVLQLMAQGSTNQEIARALTLATETIKRHVSNIISKLEVCNRTQAVVRGHSLGLLL
jgi:LuxR family maltose regulon positive regulatory protein